MDTMSSSAAMDMLRKMNEAVEAGEAGDAGLEDDGDADAGWETGLEDAGDIDTGRLPGTPRVALTEAELERALAALASAVGGIDRLTIGDIKGLLGHMYKRGHHMGHRRGFKRGGRATRDRGVRWGRSRRMNEFRVDIIDRYRRIHGGNVIEGPGFYYGTIEAVFDVETTGAGAALQAAAVINVPGPDSPIIDSCFNLGIGDTSLTWLSNTATGVGSASAQPHVLTAADTNLQNPGQNLFADELFIIEAVSARVRGAAVQYPNAIAANFPYAGPVTLSALAGVNMCWDENGEMLPVELWNGLTDYYRLAHALAENSSLHFTWSDKGIGGSNVTTDALIDTFLHVPGSYEMSVKRTSGGNSDALDLPQGYIWVLDKQFQASRDQGGNGLFDCSLHQDNPVVVPFQPLVPFGAASAIAPSKIALYWEVRLLGTSLLPGKRDYRSLEQRRRL